VGLNPYFSADNRQDMTIGQDDSGSQYLNIQPLSRNILTCLDWINAGDKTVELRRKCRKKSLTSRMSGVSVLSLLKGGMREKAEAREAKVNISKVCAEECVSRMIVRGPCPWAPGDRKIRPDHISGGNL
jgi:hypothetical protein